MVKSNKIKLPVSVFVLLSNERSCLHIGFILLGQHVIHYIYEAFKKRKLIAITGNDRLLVIFLGLTIDASLNWTSHVNAVSKKLAAAKYATRLTKVFNDMTVQVAYFALFHFSGGWFTVTVRPKNQQNKQRVFKKKETVLNFFMNIHTYRHYSCTRRCKSRYYILHQNIFRLICHFRLVVV